MRVIEQGFNRKSLQGYIKNENYKNELMVSATIQLASVKEPEFKLRSA